MRKVAAITIILTIVSFGVEHSHANRLPGYVSREQAADAIRAALRERGLAIEFKNDQLTTANVPVKATVPVLEVERLTVTNQNSIEARLRCTANGCLPFHVAISGITATKLRSGTYLSGTRTQEPDMRPQAIRAGDKAKLRLVSPGISLSIPVVCLHSGAIGEFIRVREPHTGRVMLGRLESPGILSAGRTR